MKLPWFCNLLFLAAYTALAQPGLPPCWLMEQPCGVHPHPFGHPEIPHSHEYLFDMSNGLVAVVTPFELDAAATLIALMAMTNLWVLLSDQTFFIQGKEPVPELPPPKFALALFLR